MVEIIILFACLALLIKPVGDYLHLVYSGDLAYKYRWVERLENLCSRIIGVNFHQPMTWKHYVVQLLAFLALCFFAAFIFLLIQPGVAVAVSMDLAFNITTSFLTATNIQTYIPEQTLNMISQNFGIMLLQFIAPACDMAVAVALFRAFSSTAETIGNFWQDLLRGILFILLPAAFIVATIALSQGVVQSLEPIIVQTLDSSTQEILTGPVASMQSISILATNGGGYFAANAAHPFVTPTPLMAFANMLLILLLPAAFVYLFGLMIADRRQSFTLLSVISVCVLFFAGITIWQENTLPPAIADLNLDINAGNMEGKELRVGASNSALWGILATATANGSAIAAYESFAPLSKLSMMLQMLFGEVLLGGVGSGMVNMLAMVIITVFLASLMIGRSPEYLRKRLEVFDIKLSVLMLVIPAVFLCVAISFSVSFPFAAEYMQFQNTYGYTESLYVTTSAAFNNGSSLGGIHLNNSYYNILLGIGMLFSSVSTKVIACALAGSIASKQKIAANMYALNTHGVLFAFLLLMVIVIAALSYLPILILGPISHHIEGLI